MQKTDKPAVMTLLHTTGMFSAAEIDVAEELIDVYLEQPAQNDYHIVVIENPERGIAGYMTYGPTPLTRGAYDLYWIAVSPQEQGRGYGRKMMNWLENHLEENNGRLLIIETSSQIKYANTRSFYVNQQYRETVRIADFYQPGDDRIIYVKYFSQRS
jgi:ribosomal protein S18 acetylase RimI-like enzyme